MNACVKKILVLAFVCLGVGGAYAKQGIHQLRVGDWAPMFAPSPFHSLVEVDYLVYTAKSTELMLLDRRDNTLVRIWKKQGLSGVGITAMAYHTTTRTMVIGYSDGRIDLLKDNDVTTITDLYEKALQVDKGIRHIYFDDNLAYLSCGFGLLILDVARQQIKETYFIGENNSALEVNQSMIKDNIIYLATEKGLKYASRTAHNLSDYAAWQDESGLGQGEFTNVLKREDQIWAVQAAAYDSLADVIWVKIGQEWQSVQENDIYRVQKLVYQAPYFVWLVQRGVFQPWTVEVYDQDLAFVKEEVFGGISEYVQPLDAFYNARGELWVCGKNNRTVGFQPNGEPLWYGVDGPVSDDGYKFSATLEGVYIADGGVNPDYSPRYKKLGVSVFKDNGWKNYIRDNMPVLGNFSDAVDVAEAPSDPTHFFVASYTRGVLEFKDGEFVKRHPLEKGKETTCTGQKEFRLDSNEESRVHCIAFDGNGNLWALLIGGEKGLWKMNPQGVWQGFDISFLNPGYRLSDMMIDYWNQIWIVDNQSRLMVFKQLSETELDGVYVNMNNANDHTTSRVTTLVEDDLGYVWIGTERGVKVIKEHAQIFTKRTGNYTNVPVLTVMVPSGDYVIELLKNHRINAIAVDAANRKWVGTQSDGIYVLSEDGLETVAHFTAENSALISNEIFDLAASRRDGVVYVSTDKGMLKYKSAAAEREEEEKAYAFPNPVRPDYQGLISIKNLPNESLVKITDLSGNLIYQGRSTGGQFVWDGRDFHGRKPSSGVLLVFACKEEDGSQKMVCKIFYVK